MNSANTSVRSAGDVMEKFARLGFAAKGVVYLIVGGLAAKGALGSGGGNTDSHGALAEIAQKPFGRTLLYVIVAGLLGYAIWRILEALVDSEDRGTKPKGLALRIGVFIRAIVYGALAMQAFRLASRSGGSGESGDSSAKHWADRLMDKPFGRTLAVLIGLIVVGYGFYQLYRAFSKKYAKKLDLSRVPMETRQWLLRVSTFGVAARGIVFGMVGFYLARAAWRHDPEQARGFAGALRGIESQPYGKWLLAVTAIGLVAYGVFEIINGLYRKMRPVM